MISSNIVRTGRRYRRSRQLKNHEWVRLQHSGDGRYTSIRSGEVGCCLKTTAAQTIKLTRCGDRATRRRDTEGVGLVAPDKIHNRHFYHGGLAGPNHSGRIFEDNGYDFFAIVGNERLQLRAGLLAIFIRIRSPGANRWGQRTAVTETVRRAIAVGDGPQQTLHVHCHRSAGGAFTDQGEVGKCRRS